MEMTRSREFALLFSGLTFALSLAALALLSTAAVLLVWVAAVAILWAQSL
jgi:hypothetical protein